MAKKYEKLNYVSFERTLRPYCKGVIEVENAQGITVRKNITAQYLDSKILLTSGLDEDEVERFEFGDGIKSFGINKDSLSAFRSGGVISPWIVNTYTAKAKARDEFVQKVSGHFESQLMPYLQGRRSNDAKRSIFSIINADASIPSKELVILKKSYNDDTDCIFLAKSFIYSMIQDQFAENLEYTNAAVEQVLSDIKITGWSTLLNGMVDSIYECSVEGLTILDRMTYYQEDIIKFVLGVLPVAEKLDEQHRAKFIEIRMRALEYEMNGEFKAGIASACNALFRKYWIGDKEFEISKIHWSDDANILNLQLRNKPINPVFVTKASDLANVETMEDLAKLFGVNVEDIAHLDF